MTSQDTRRVWPKSLGHSPSDSLLPLHTLSLSEADVIAVARQPDWRRLTPSQRAWRKATRKRATLTLGELSRLAYMTGCRPAAIAQALVMGVFNG